MATSDVKKDGIAYAPTREGYLLPVMDVTHTRFAVPDSPADLENLHRALRASERRRRLVPKFLMRVMLKSAAEKSRLLHALFATDATFLDGTTTYVMKLGADNLVPPFDSPVDRRLASSPQATFLRLRTQQVAQLAAQALVGELAAGAAPIHLVNIGGGPAFDSINALIILARFHPELLGRKIVIDVLDADDAGAFFGGNALAALRTEGQPLAGLDIDFRHRTYDWNKPCVLREMIDDLAAQGAILAASSEGGLFEYGSDEAIVENLRALRAGGRGANFVTGSVTRDDELRRTMFADSRFGLIPRGLGRFGPLAAEAGFSIAESRSAAWSDQVLLRPVEEG